MGGFEPRISSTETRTPCLVRLTLMVDAAGGTTAGSTFLANWNTPKSVSLYTPRSGAPPWIRDLPQVELYPLHTHCSRHCRTRYCVGYVECAGSLVWRNVENEKYDQILFCSPKWLPRSPCRLRSGRRSSSTSRTPTSGGMVSCPNRSLPTPTAVSGGIPHPCRPTCKPYLHLCTNAVASVQLSAKLRPALRLLAAVDNRSALTSCTAFPLGVPATPRAPFPQKQLSRLR